MSQYLLFFLSENIKSQPKSMVFLLLGYMWLFIHRPFEVWPILGSIRIERVYMLTILAFWFLFHNKGFLSNRAVVAVLFLFCSIMLSDFLSPFNAGAGIDKATEEWLKVFLFVILVVTSIRTEAELKILLTGFCFIFFIYMAHSFYEFRNGRHVYRMGTVRMIGIDEAMNDANTFGASIVYAIPMLIPLWHLKGKTIWFGLAMKIFAISSFALSMLCIILTGSRSAFVASILLLATLAVISKHRIRWMVILLLASPLVWACMSENLKERYLTLIDPSRGPTSAQDSAEGRWDGLKMGINLWKKYPVFGVGPGVSPNFSPTKLQTHNLVGQVLAELGSLGAFAYLLISGVIVMNLWQARRDNKIYRLLRPPGDDYLYMVSIATVITMLQLHFLGIAGHNAYRYTWIWYTVFQGIAVMLLAQKIQKIADQNEKIPGKNTVPPPKFEKNRQQKYALNLENEDSR